MLFFPRHCLVKMFKYIMLIIILLTYINAQLTIQDKKFIENFILRGQSSSSGLFFEENDAYLHTYQAIKSLKILGVDVKYKSEICDKISDTKKVSLEIVLIDELLECKTKFSQYKPDFSTTKLVDIYKEALLMENLKMKEKWSDLYKNLKGFMSNNKFMLLKTKEKKDKSAIATALGVEILTIIGNNEPDLKDEIIGVLDPVVNVLYNSYTNLNDEIIVFNDKNAANYRVNYHIIKALKAAKKLGIKIKGLNDILYKLLNYFITFKYEFASSIENSYYLLGIYKQLEKTPLIKFPYESFNYKKDKNVRVKFENVFGEKVEIKNSVITLKVEEDANKKIDTNSKKKKSSSSYDLEDSDTQEESNSSGESSAKVEIKDTKENYVEFNLSQLIKKPGFFLVSITMENNVYLLNEHFVKTIRSYSDVNLESLSFEIIDKIDDSKNQQFPKVNNPNKYEETFKANQDNTLIVRLKVSFEDKKLPTKMEQVFFRLKNTELNKSYNAYSSKFNAEENEYFIGFELDDPVNMESYNGQYKMIIVISDPGSKIVKYWEFGSIDISFTKPTDPLEVERSLKNPQQPKMEPTFSPDTNRQKNQFLGIVFSVIILGFTVILIYVVLKSKSNIANFPKAPFGSLMNLLFVTLLGLIAYILFLFWVKLNILETMFIFVLMVIPATFIIYKALKNHEIEIVVEKPEED